MLIKNETETLNLKFERKKTRQISSNLVICIKKTGHSSFELCSV